MTDPALVRHAIVGAVCTITLDSQHNRNALSLELVRQLHVALDAAEQASARVIVLNHVGPTFCSGADLKERRGVPADECGPYISAISGG